MIAIALLAGCCAIAHADGPIREFRSHWIADRCVSTESGFSCAPARSEAQVVAIPLQLIRIEDDGDALWGGSKYQRFSVEGVALGARILIEEFVPASAARRPSVQLNLKIDRLDQGNETLGKIIVHAGKFTDLDSYFLPAREIRIDETTELLTYFSVTALK